MAKESEMKLCRSCNKIIQIGSEDLCPECAANTPKADVNTSGSDATGIAAVGLAQAADNRKTRLKELPRKEDIVPQSPPAHIRVNQTANPGKGQRIGDSVIIPATTYPHNNVAAGMTDPVVDEYLKYYPDIISAIGLSNTGKSFFINRLCHKLATERSWSVSKRCDIINLTDNVISPTFLIPNKGNLFGKKKHYLILDCGGEDFANGIDQFSMHANSNDPLPLQNICNGRFLLMLGLARAYFFFIDFQEMAEMNEMEMRTAGLNGHLLGAGQDDDKTQSQISNEMEQIKRKNFERIEIFFKHLTALIVVLENRITKEAVKNGTKWILSELMKQPIKYGDLTDKMLEGKKSRKPIYVLFSRADLYNGLPWFEKSCSDPHGLMAEQEKILYSDIANRFHKFHFDFVSAFDGHKPDDDEETTEDQLNIGSGAGCFPNYNSPCCGVTEAFDWVVQEMNDMFPINHFDIFPRTCWGPLFPAKRLFDRLGKARG